MTLQISAVQAKSRMEDSNSVTMDKHTTIHSMLLLIQNELVNIRKEQTTEEEEREADKREMSAIIGNLVNTLRKDIACEIETRFDSIPFTLYVGGQCQRSEELRTVNWSFTRTQRASATL